MSNARHGFRQVNHQHFFQNALQLLMPFALVLQGWMCAQIRFSRVIGKFPPLPNRPVL